MEFKPAVNTINTNVANTTVTTTKKGAAFDVKRYLGMVLGAWYWIILSLIIAFAIGYIYLQVTKPIYVIKSALVVTEDDNTNSDILDKLNIVKKAPVNFFNEINALKSEDLITQAVDTLNLNVTYFIKSKLRDQELYNESPIRVVFDSSGYKGDHTEMYVKYTSDGHFDLREGSKTVDVPYDSWITRSFGRFKILYNYDPSNPNKYLTKEINVRVKDPQYTVRDIESDFKVTSADGRTSVMDLAYRDNIPERGIDLLNTLVRIYYRNKFKNIDLSAQKTRDFINDHKKNLMDNLNGVDSTVEHIKEQNGVVDLPGQTNTYMNEKNETEKNIDKLLTRRRALINLRYLLLNSRYQILVALDIDDNILQGLVIQYNTLVQKLETQEKVQELGASNPFLIQTIVELEALKRRMLDVLNRLSGSLESDLQVATKSNADYNDKIRSVPGIDRSITQVRRGYDVTQDMYLFLFKKGIENDIAVYNEANKSKVLIAPYSSSQPVFPLKYNIYLLALLIGLLIPLLLLFIRQLLIRKIVNESDIKAITEIPIIGVISKIDPDKLRYNYIAISSSVRTGISEQFRMLRTNLEFIPFTENRKVITVTSSDSGEGKTFISLNLGFILALGTKRVVVVEFDLRKPKMSEFLRIKDNNGVSDYLMGKAELKDVIKPSGINSNLYIANCGQAPSNPGDLLAYPSTGKLIEELQEMFDIVILDTPPLGLVPDALVLSRFAGLNLFVIRQAVTTKKQVREFDALHRDGKMHNPAIVFNGVGYLKQYGYYYNPNREYENKLAEYGTSTTPNEGGHSTPGGSNKGGFFSFFKR